MESLRKEFKFPKVAYTSSRKVNLPVVEMELKYKNGDHNKPALSICGKLWNARHTDIVMGGQCLDEMAKLGDLRFNTLFRKLHRLWKRWHLNDMCAGTIKQEAALEDASKSGVKFCTYDDRCNYLKSINLYNDDGYEYGTGWIYRKIDDHDLIEIKTLLSDEDDYEG